MDKKNQQQDHLDYWQKRQEDIVSYLDRADLDIFNELSRVYSNQSLSLQKDLYDFYNRF
ncbi:phage head morphogenesis protein, partial [Streptococcus agalactiae]|nr:phage head morphogenesis protein [Streptococcus agalactiae]